MHGDLECLPKRNFDVDGDEERAREHLAESTRPGCENDFQPNPNGAQKLLSKVRIQREILKPAVMHMSLYAYDLVLVFLVNFPQNCKVAIFGHLILSQVKRTSSFAALRPKKNGLVALARDIEKKFRKKRRSKTADFSELLKVQEATGDRARETETETSKTDEKDEVFKKPDDDEDDENESSSSHKDKDGSFDVSF